MLGTEKPVLERLPEGNREEAQSGIARWIGEYNHDRPHQSLKNRMPREVLAEFTGVLKTEALPV